MQRPREFSERLGELPAGYFRAPRIDLPVSPGVETKRNLAKRGNFSPAVPFITSNGRTPALGLNGRRIYLLVYNNDTINALWVNLGVPAAVNQCVRVPPGGNWEPWTAPINEIYLIGDVNGQTCILMEGSHA